MKLFNRQIFRKAKALLIASVMVTASILPFINIGIAHAYGLVTSRSIEMSTSAASATAVTYQVGFTTATTGTVQGIVVDFCSTDPIIGDTCTAPAGFTVGTPTVATSGGSNVGLSGTWTAGSLNTGRTLTLVNGTGGSISSGTSIIFTLSTATNPSATNTTFYARILTYATSGGATGYTDTVPGSVIDAGGVALSTANQITITAKVQEQITFCVYTGANCAAGGSTVTLGNTNGVLSSSGPYVDKNTKYDISTNASSGVIIRLKGDTLKFGANSIAAIGSTAASSAAGTAQFGLCTYQSTGANLTTTSPYNNANCSTTTQTAGTGSTGGNGTAQFALDTTNTNTTFGQQMATATAGPSSTGTIAFIANIPTTQVAGIYTTVLTFIATGTY